MPCVLKIARKPVGEFLIRTRMRNENMFHNNPPIFLAFPTTLKLL